MGEEIQKERDYTKVTVERKIDGRVFKNTIEQNRSDFDIHDFFWEVMQPMALSFGFSEELINNFFEINKDGK